MDKKKERVAEIEEISARPDSWSDMEKSHKLQKERKNLETVISAWEKQNTLLGESEELYAMGVAEKDDATLKEIEITVNQVEARVIDLEFLHMMNGENDRNSAIITINSGAGGTEAQDWVEILMRMYLRYCDIKGFKTNVLDALYGDEAGYKNVTFTAEGEYAYGYLKAEIGIHRLVRNSPFNSSNKRETSFSSVFVYPEVDESIDIDVKDSDLRIDTFRAGGKGGQHVNKTDSAVRVTHIPSGIVVQCQNERSQHKNKAMALKVLRARLYKAEIEKRDKEKDVVEATKKDIGWGSQIRSYVLSPYRLIKDHRTNLEDGDVAKVLDGDLDKFIRGYLMGLREPKHPTEK